MKIESIILKDKSIIVNPGQITPQMKINLNRINMMPEAPIENHFQCELRLEINIEDNANNILATLKIGYIINAQLDSGDNYKQNEYADRIYNVLQAMYITIANDLLRDSPFPPIPFNIVC